MPNSQTPMDKACVCHTCHTSAHGSYMTHMHTTQAYRHMHQIKFMRRGRRLYRREDHDALVGSRTSFWERKVQRLWGNRKSVGGAMGGFGVLGLVAANHPARFLQHLVYPSPPLVHRTARPPPRRPPTLAPECRTVRTNVPPHRLSHELVSTLPTFFECAHNTSGTAHSRCPRAFNTGYSYPRISNFDVFP
jgi:hypothetical protein